MTDKLRMRGPDDEGFWSGEGAVFGHRRLSIIDLEGGQQPVVIDRNGEHVLVFNGEIYNYKEIQSKLAAAGIPCRTASDTEALMRWVLHKKLPGALSDLMGMFAFACWDNKSRRLVLVRDRVGIKPLYYHLASDGTLSFSSELASLLQNSSIDRKVDTDSLSYFLALGYCPAPLTLYSGIRELPPGHMLIWDKGKIELKCYWHLNWDTTFTGTEDEAAEALDDLLTRVIADHMVSDVPVGAFLSGGIDSSTVVSYMARKHSRDFDAYTVQFSDPGYDESAYAKLVADHCGVRHKVLPMESTVLNEDVCRFTLQHVGQPFADSSCLPTHLVSRAASEHVKVILAGDGGDELFAGYETFGWGNRVRGIQSFPVSVRKILIAAISSASRILPWADLLRQLSKGLRYGLQDQSNLILRLSCILDPEDLPDLCSGYGGRTPSLDLIGKFVENEKHLDFIPALSRFLFAYSLPGDMLRKVDRMSMATSLEVRVPFLDHRLIEFAAGLPDQMKVKDGKRKALLRRVMRDRLPDEVFDHKKWGFSIPLHNAFNAEFLNFCRNKLTSPSSQVNRLFGKESVDKILSWNMAAKNPISRRFSTYTVNHLLWMMIQLELWTEDFHVDLPEAL
jgi:asparagine synthase (glutamine-hydrolysing)